MTTYNTISNASVAVDAPITTSLMTALRDNPLAIQERDATAPQIVFRTVDIITSSQTWNRPANIDQVLSLLQAAGGGGGAYQISNGGNAGASSFGAFQTCNGGVGGQSGTGNSDADGGSATGGNIINLKGNGNFRPNQGKYKISNTLLGVGGVLNFVSQNNVDFLDSTGYGVGGIGGYWTQQPANFGTHGTNGGFSAGIYTVTTDVSVTIGAPGNGASTGGQTRAGQTGQPGVCILFY